MFLRKPPKTLKAQDLIESLVSHTKANITKRIREIDFALLGRSLACNPFVPRLRDGDIDCIEIFNDVDLERLKPPTNLHALIANTMLKSDISLVSNARIYTQFLIIHSDIFISTYQILESAVYGADMIVLICDVLTRDSLRELYDYASHLGLGVCALVKNIDEVDFARNIGIEFFIPQNASLSALIHSNIISIK